MNLDDMFATNDTQSVDNKLDAQRKIDRLDHLDRALLYLWVCGYSQCELAHIFGYTQGHISKLLDKLHTKQ